jgi:signal transduction histidine kinase
MPHTGFTWGTRGAPARWTATITTLCGLVALAGWIFHLPALTSVLSGSVEMKANTAIALILCGIAQLILAERSSVALERVAQILALAAAAIGLATLCEYLFAWQLGIDELLFKDIADAFNVFRGRMSPYSAATFVAIGIALAAGPVKSLNRLSQLTAAVVIAVGLISLVGYLWKAGELITDRWLPPVAINTATCFVLLGMGIVLSPDRSEVKRDKRIMALADVEIKILLGFLLAMALLMFGGSYTYRASAEFAGSVEWVAHTQEVRATLADLYGSVVGAELAQRDYVIDGEQDRLGEYRRLLKVVQADIAAVRNLTLDSPIQQQNLLALSAAIVARVNVMGSEFEAYHSYGLAAARAVRKIGRTDNSDQVLRAVIDRMDGVEVALLAARRAATDSVRHTTFISLLITLTVASGLFFVLFRGIHREMLARREAEQSIRELNAELQENAIELQATNKELESFSYSVSHDLRAPLRAIDGYAAMLEEDCRESLDAEGRRFLAVIRDNGRRMGALIDDLLALSRLGRQPVADREVNVDSLVREVVDEILGAAAGTAAGSASAGNTPVPQIQLDPLPNTHGDRGLLRQVWVNLIANAVKYSSKAAQPLIHVSGRQVGAENHYSVKDNGVGFNMEYADKLFGVFQRLHRADEFGGTGVGLAIVQRVVTRHGGRVWADGKVDQGAVFSFALPNGERHE